MEIKKDITTLSITEAEYVAVAEYAKEAKYLERFYEDLTKEQIRLVMMVDNQSVIHLVKSGQKYMKTKYIDVRYLFLSKNIKKEFLTLSIVQQRSKLLTSLQSP